MTNVGEVDFLVDFDGRGLPAKTRAIGEKAGAAGGQAMNKSFNREATKGFEKQFSALGGRIERTMARTGKLSGIKFDKSLRASVKSGVQGLTDELAVVFGKRNRIDNYAKKFDTVGDAVRKLQADLRYLSDRKVLGNDRWLELSDALQKWRLEAEKAETAARDLADRQAEVTRVMAERERGLRIETDRLDAALSGRTGFDDYARKAGGTWYVAQVFGTE